MVEIEWLRERGWVGVSSEGRVCVCVGGGGVKDKQGHGKTRRFLQDRGGRNKIYEEAEIRAEGKETKRQRGAVS